MAEVRNASSVFVIAPNWVGDAVMCLPAIDALVRALPGAEICVLARPPVASVFRAAGITVEVTPAGITGMRRAWVLGRRRRPDITVVFPNSFYSGLIAWLTRARTRIGYLRDARGMLLSDALPCPAKGATPPHESFYYLELLRRAEIIDRLPASVSVQLRPDERLVAHWQNELRNRNPQRTGAPIDAERSLAPTDAPIVAIHAGATFGTAKRWLPERFAAVAAELSARGVQVVFVGSGAERSLAQSILEQSRTLRPDGIPPLNIAGQTTLDEAIAVLAAADLLISNDSGPMHLAATVGTPVVAIFGSTNERETHPIAQTGKLRIVKAPGVECSPCKLRECPIDHRCMTRVEVGEVLDAALAGLSSSRDSRNDFYGAKTI